MKTVIHMIRTLNKVVSFACCILIFLFGIKENIPKVVVWSYVVILLSTIINILLLMIAKKNKWMTIKLGEIIELIVIAVIFLLGLLKYFLLN
ncbi:hypothetical protein C824_005556 [Schaedlerella arabinosiphila]|nr:hypothetical protein C824_005556 [Schaedlerella arabinosiphila]